MGFRWRKRSGGKKAWFNWSASTGNGFGGSVSIKPTKNTTINVKNGRVRTTINLGNGLFYTKSRTLDAYRKRKPKPKGPTKAELRAAEKAREAKALLDKQLAAAALKELEEYYQWFNTLTEEEQAEQLDRFKYHRDAIKKLYNKQQTESTLVIVVLGLSIVIICKFLGWLFF